MGHNIEKRLDKENDLLVSLLDRGENLISGLGAVFNRDAQKLSALKDRLMNGRFHLANLGQFKRGKSTLLNALVCEPVQPVSVVPLTAVPTFIQFGPDPLIRIRSEKAADQMASLKKPVNAFQNRLYEQLVPRPKILHPVTAKSIIHLPQYSIIAIVSKAY